MRRHLTPGLAVLRATGFAALLLLLWNPVSTRLLPADAPPLVLLDASLSMTGHGGQWRAALDTAKGLGGVIWRFGAGVAAFDSGPPADGASRLGPALEAAVARGGPVVVVTDGGIEDLAELPPDLLRWPQVVLLPRQNYPDAFVAEVAGPRRMAATDTMRLTVSVGTAGKRETGNGLQRATLAVNLAGRSLVRRDVTLPDSGTVSVDLTLPASRLPTGWSALEVRLDGVGDPEPRDDARVFALEVSPQPAVVLLASPPDWETRFLARTLGDVTRVPVKVFAAMEPPTAGGGGDGQVRWRDGATLAEVPAAQVARAVGGARLIVLGGDPASLARFHPRSATLLWPTGQGIEGDWYVQSPPPSPLASMLAGIAWDSLPPATSLLQFGPSRDSATAVAPALTARLARQGAPRPVLLLRDSAGQRGATVAAGGLWRWSFHGGAGAVAYRTLVASLVDWLLGGSPAGAADRVVPERLEVPNGLPLGWRWTGRGAPRDLVVALQAATGGRDGGGERVDTLRFDADGRAQLHLLPGVYRYAVRDGRERGLVAVETYSDEWRPAPARLTARAGALAGRIASVGLRDRWWLFVLAIIAFAAEWAWRRRQGLP